MKMYNVMVDGFPVVGGPFEKDKAQEHYDEQKRWLSQRVELVEVSDGEEA